MYENIQDAPGSYVTCHFAGCPHKHTGYIPKYLLEVRPRLFFFFNLQTVFFFLGFLKSLCILPGDHSLYFWKVDVVLTNPDIVI